VSPTLAEAQEACRQLGGENAAIVSRYLESLEDDNGLGAIDCLEIAAIRFDSCAEIIETWGHYAMEHFQEKHCLTADIACAKSAAIEARNQAARLRGQA
jgi:hypothetical protein